MIRAASRAMKYLALGSLGPMLLSGPLAAQVRVPRLGEYSRIVFESDTAASWVTGWLAELTTYDLVIRNEMGRELRVPINTLHRFQVRRGTHMREAAILGAAMGVGIGLISGESAKLKLLIAGTGAASFGVAGASLGRRYPRWLSVDVAYLMAGPFGRPRLGLGFAIR